MITMLRKTIALTIPVTLAASLLVTATLIGAQNANAAFPGTNGKIAFTRLAADFSTTAVYVMNADGTGQTMLTSGSDPAWSPDGTRIAYASSGILLMNADGSGHKSLTISGSTPAWSPDGSKIAFTDWNPSYTNEDIYVMNANGSGLTRLTGVAIGGDGDSFDVSPAWSPDGSKIAFVSNRDGNNEIYLMNPDGTGQTRLTNNTSDDRVPAWSPDGSKLAFQSFAQNGNGQIDVMNADGSGLVDLSVDTDAEGEPGWSPDGSRIAFIHLENDFTDEIYTMNADGSGRVRLTTNTAYDEDPDWQPLPPPKAGLAPNSLSFANQLVGSTSAAQQVTITNTAAIAGGGDLQIGNLSTAGADAGDFTFANDHCSGASLAAQASCTVDVSFVPTAAGGRSARVVVPSNAASSPDEVGLSGVGTVAVHGVNGKIAFTSFRDGNPEIYTMAADGSGQARLTSNLAPDTEPSWSPDGQRIAFVSNRDGNAEIYVMAADGSGQARLTNNLAMDIQPSWSPDGQRIAFVSYRDGDPEIYVMGADGSNVTQLTNNSAGDLQPAWSPDAGKIAFTSDRDGTAQVYVMDADGAQQMRLTSSGASEPAWSPDGSEILYTAAAGGIGVMGADGAHPAPLISDPTARQPAWSPDGAEIAYTGLDGIYVMGADGSNPTRLTRVLLPEMDPDWQPMPPPAPPQVLLAPTSLNFGDEPVGSTSSAQQVTIRNTGDEDLVIGLLATEGAGAGDFVLGTDMCSNATLGADKTCTVEVTFTPTAAGGRAASLAVPSNAASSPDSVALTGAGVAPSADVRVTTTGPATTAKATQVTYVLTVTNIGPSAAHNVVLSNSVPSGARVLGITTSQGSCGKPSKGTITCSLGDLATGSSVGSQVTVRVTAKVGGTVTDAAGAYSTADAAGPATADPDLTNNRASVTTTVTR
jgi:uncharacterized repeat protein (TIGR01451 family)